MCRLVRYLVKNYPELAGNAPSRYEVLGIHSATMGSSEPALTRARGILRQVFRPFIGCDIIRRARDSFG
jgi:hypothetical protein